MRYLQGIITWIDSLESGRQFRSWAVILFRILGAATLVGVSGWGIVICVDTIAANKDSETISFLVIIGAILEVCITITLTMLLTMLFWHRSNKIKTLDNDPNFLLISITVITVQLLGEISFLGLIGISVQTLVSSIFGSGLPKFSETLLRGPELMNIFPINSSGNITFISSVILSLISVLSGAILLIVSYFISEEINVLANIAESLNNIETKLLDEEPASDS